MPHFQPGGLDEGVVAASAQLVFLKNLNRKLSNVEQNFCNKRVKSAL